MSKDVLKIGIDATRAVTEQAGIGRYSREVVRSFLSHHPDCDFTLLYTFMRDRSGGKQDQIATLAALNQRVRTRVIRLPGKWKEFLWGKRWGPSFLDQLIGRQDVFLATSFLEVDLASRLPIVLTIFDLSMFLYPEQRGIALSRYLARRTAVAVEKARRVLAISESTKRDLIKVLPVPEEKITVIFQGAADVFYRPPDSNDLKRLKLEYDLNENFILSVGTLEPRKNIPRLLEAYSLLPVKFKERYDLVIVGGKGWNEAGIFETVRRRNLEKRVRFLGFVPDADLNGLYRLATIFVYPSLYEGFGLPVLEAITAGVPTITSDASSLPEAGGRAALYVDPRDIGDIQAKMKLLLSDAALRAKLKRNGHAHARKFSWDKTAQITFQALEEVARDARRQP